MTTSYAAINFAEKFAAFSERWSPRIIAQMNGYHFKLVKIEGEFVWHAHADTDEVFIVVDGELTIHFRDGEVGLRSDPPYQQKRPRDARLASLRAALAASPSWVLSGSLCGWGDPLVPEFELAVLLVVPTAVRLARLRVRELDRYGPAALAPGGALHRTHVEFLDWAARYDEGGLDMRSRALH